jgi:hypothetical protein
LTKLQYLKFSLFMRPISVAIFGVIRHEFDILQIMSVSTVDNLVPLRSTDSSAGIHCYVYLAQAKPSI